MLIEVETLKGELGQSQEKLQKEIDLNHSLSQEILKKAQDAKVDAVDTVVDPGDQVENGEQAEKIDELARDVDEYTEIASVKEPEQVNIPSPEPQEIVPNLVN